MEDKIKFAKEFEEYGAMLYINTGMKSENLITKKLFYSLAKQEIEHLEAIENFVVNRAYPGNKEETVEKEIKEFFDALKEKSRIEKQTDGYKTALEVEKKGYLQYEKFYKEAKDEKEKQFFKFLMEQEKSHIDAIVNVYSYITQTGDWFEKEESRTWNWMNL
ncbi:MAG TPA: ferritin family protein [bacterium]|nr:ferritin family protein [bacterium]HPO91728.1 ferritin family protein [Victivallales bacterium]